MMAFSAGVHFDCFLAGVADGCCSSGAGLLAVVAVVNPGEVGNPAADVTKGPESGEISRRGGRGKLPGGGLDESRFPCTRRWCGGTVDAGCCWGGSWWCPDADAG